MKVEHFDFVALEIFSGCRVEYRIIYLKCTISMRDAVVTFGFGPVNTWIARAVSAVRCTWRFFLPLDSRPNKIYKFTTKWKSCNFISVSAFLCARKVHAEERIYNLHVHAFAL